VDKNHTPDSSTTFAELCLREAGLIAKKHGRPAEPFTHLSYDDEREIKMRAFSAFCAAEKLEKPEALVAAPNPRNYRTTSKRRMKIINGRARLICDIDEPELVSRLEPENHSRIFAECESLLPDISQKVAANLNFCIVRGESECAVIFNLARVDRQTVHAMTQLAELIRAAVPALVSAFIFHDPSRSKYYLEAEAVNENSFKRLFGPRVLRVRAGGMLFQHHPLSFSQVNAQVAEKIAQKISSYFGTRGDALADLYCGYGFFSCLVGSSFQTITGIDSARESIASAKENAGHLCKSSRNAFYLHSIEAKVIEDLIPPLRGEVSMILDPPRKGCARGVIAACAQVRPVRVAHLFCGAEQIARECSLWRTEGYRASEIIPFDMFAGTTSIETLVLFEVQRKA